VASEVPPNLQTVRGMVFPSFPKEYKGKKINVGQEQNNSHEKTSLNPLIRDRVSL